MSLLDNSVKFNSISDFLFEKNIPFEVENKVLHRLNIFPKWEYSALTQLNLAPVSNNIVRGFFSTFIFWQIFKNTGAL